MAYLGNDLSTIVKQGKTAYKYVATEGQTSFSGSDANGITLKCTADTFVNVYLNGVRLIKGDDFTLGSNELTLLVGATLADELLIVADIESATFTSYTKSETDQKIVELSPPTDLSAYSTTTQMNAAINGAVDGLIDTAPDALNTLNELSAALNDDANFATTVTNSLALKANSADVYTQSEIDTAIDEAVNSAFKLNPTSISTSYSIPSGSNAMTAGPITLADGVTITVPDGSSWTIV